MQGKEVRCPWQGCRACGLSGRLQTTLAELQDLRDALMSETPDWGDAVVVRIMHTLKLKMAWVDQGPALVWQALEPASAKKLLDERDALVAAGGLPHRVTEIFAAPGSEMRAAMEAHAAGGGMSACLREELLAYGLAKIDDTWAEAAHRDVSSLAKRCPGAKVPYMAAR